MSEYLRSFPKVFVVGVCRNVGDVLEKQIEVLSSSIDHPNVEFFIVESDSLDETLSVLERISEAMKNFGFVSLGRLDGNYVERTVRIAHCRNYYMDYLEKQATVHDLVVVADLDGANLDLTKERFNRILERLDWDACCANQTFAYFDIWALRHPTWCPEDWMDNYKSLVEKGMRSKRALEESLYRRMVRIEKNEPWIEVDSAFGGLAIYKYQIIQGLRYLGKIGTKTICEHVPFNQGIRERNGRIFIVPGLINSEMSHHTLILKKTVKIKTIMRKIQQHLVKK